MILMYVHLIYPQHGSMILMFDDHDLDDIYQSDYDHSILMRKFRMLMMILRQSTLV